MSNRQDYLMDENFDLIIREGDFVVSNSDQNNKAVHILARPGHIKQYVRIGAGIEQELNGTLNQNTRRIILQSFKRDKYDLRGISFNGNQIIIP